MLNKKMFLQMTKKNYDQSIYDVYAFWMYTKEKFAQIKKAIKNQSMKNSFFVKVVA